MRLILLIGLLFFGFIWFFGVQTGLGPYALDLALDRVSKNQSGSPAVTGQGDRSANGAAFIEIQTDDKKWKVVVIRPHTGNED